MVIISAKELINPDQKYQINQLSSSSFGHETINPIVEKSALNGSIIGYIVMDNIIVSSGFGQEDTYNNNYNYKTMYLNTFSTHENYRGQGLCTKLINEFVKKYGKTHVLYLTVRTEENNVNEPAIRCYEKNNFLLLPKVYRDHYDGKNNAMIRFPTFRKKITTKKKRKKRKKSR